MTKGSVVRLGYFGDGPWASRALLHIAAQPERFAVAFITPRFDTQDPELKKWAEKLDVPFLPHANVNAPEFIEQVGTFGCDLMVSMSFNQILKKPIINAAPLGFINCHAGALPFYRGRNPLNWALINGETEFGVTVHYIDEGIDTGDIILQTMVPIGPDDDYAALLDKAHFACADTLIEALLIIDEAGEGARVLARKQDEIDPVGSYFTRRREGDERIDWSMSAQQLHNFIRALNVPGPGARARTSGGEVALLRSRLIDVIPSTRRSGEIVGQTTEGSILQTSSGCLLITEAAAIEAQGMPGNVFVPRWPVGMRLDFSR